MIDPPRIANLLSVGQHKLSYFYHYKKENIKCKAFPRINCRLSANEETEQMGYSKRALFLPN